MDNNYAIIRTVRKGGVLMEVAKFLISNFQVLLLTFLIIITVLLLLWSGIPIILVMIYRELKSIDKTLKQNNK